MVCFNSASLLLVDTRANSTRRAVSPRLLTDAMELWSNISLLSGSAMCNGSGVLVLRGGYPPRPDDRQAHWSYVDNSSIMVIADSSAELVAHPAATPPNCLPRTSSSRRGQEDIEQQRGRGKAAEFVPVLCRTSGARRDPLVPPRPGLGRGESLPSLMLTVGARSSRAAGLLDAADFY